MGLLERSVPRKIANSLKDLVTKKRYRNLEGYFLAFFCILSLVCSELLVNMIVIK